MVAGSLRIFVTSAASVASISGVGNRQAPWASLAGPLTSCCKI
jgi:hypothetical protein